VEVRNKGKYLIAPLNQKDTGFRNFADPDYLRRILAMFPNV
jgi:hypothetical protein